LADCGQSNILKRLLVQGCGFNLSLVMRKLWGAGKPGQFHGLPYCFSYWWQAVVRAGSGFNSTVPPQWLLK
jgi:hypothetical protein